MKRTGTKEWSDHSANLFVGCEHDCRYCYARANAVKLGYIEDAGAWSTPRPKKTRPSTKKYTGRVMFPTTHDITRNNLHECIEFLEELLASGNEVLIVSKPSFYVVYKLCVALGGWRDQVTFRFTIGARNSEILGFWEPGARGYNVRRSALIFAFQEGWNTSVSIEPYLDPDVGQLIEELLPFVTDTIWVGKMNKVRERVENTDSETDSAIRAIEYISRDGFVEELYERYKDEPKVRWKDSIKQVLGLPEEEIG